MQPTYPRGNRPLVDNFKLKAFVNGIRYVLHKRQPLQRPWLRSSPEDRSQALYTTSWQSANNKCRGEKRMPFA